jgi:DNA-binding MarR family transcriptional regulator
MISAVLESVAVVARELMAGREPPFGRRMTRNQVDVLFILAHSAEAVTPGHLADGLGVTPGAITQLVDRLASLGLVDSTAHPHDARSRVLRLTPAARSAVDRFEGEAVRRMAHRFDGLTDEQLAPLAAWLSSVSRASPQRR